MTSTLRTSRLTRVRRRRGSLAVPLVLSFLGLALNAACAFRLVGLGPLASLAPFGAMMFLSGLAAFLVSLRLDLLREKRVGVLEANARGLFSDDGGTSGQVCLLARGDLVAGFVQPTKAGPTVRLEARGWGRSLAIHGCDDREAHALLHALGLDAANASVAFWAPSPLLVNPRAALVAILGWMLAGVFVSRYPGPLGWLYIATFLGFLLLPKRVIAGADGVRVAWLGGGRFIPYSDVVSVRLEDASLELRLRSGQDEVVTFEEPAWIGRGGSVVRGFFERSRLAMADRIREGFSLYQRRASDANLAGVLARGPQTELEWIAGLRKLGERGEGDGLAYRTVSVPRESLWRVVEDPSRPGEERAAAAVALRAKLEEGERVRLAAVADATVAPRVRLALTKAAAPRHANDGEETDEDLLRALVDAGAEEPSEPRRSKAR